jgi:hypothetical protein
LRSSVKTSSVLIPFISLFKAAPARAVTPPAGGCRTRATVLLMGL